MQEYASHDSGAGSGVHFEVVVVRVAVAVVGVVVAAVGVAMAAVPVAVTVVERVDADKVHKEPEDGHQEETFVFHLQVARFYLEYV